MILYRIDRHNFLALIGKACRHVLHRFAVIEQDFEHFANLDGFESEFRLDEI
jgi:hypothetical protein